VFRENPIRIARHIKKFHLRPFRQKLLGKFTAVQIGHDDIGEKQMEWRVMIVSEADGFQGIRSCQDLIGGTTATTAQMRPATWSCFCFSRKAFRSIKGCKAFAFEFV